MRLFSSSLRRDGAENSIMQTITIAVSAILIAAGITTAPGLINNARDNNTREDLANLAYAQESILGDEGRYATSLAEISSKATLKVKLSGESSTNIFGGTDCYAVFGKSLSNKSFYRTSASSQTFVMTGSWPASKPSGYPANCEWPASASHANLPRLTNYAPNPSFENSGAWITVGRNYAPDPAHQTGAGWLLYNSPTYTLATDDYHSAPYSRKIVTGTDGRTNGVIVQQNSYLTGGKQYASMWMKARAGSTWTAAFRLAVNGVPGFNESEGLISVVGTGAWQLVKLEATIPSASYSSIGMYVKQGGSAETAYFDDAQILGGQGFIDFFTGSTPAAGDFNYSWEGVPNNSVSRAVARAPEGVENSNQVSYQSQSTKGTGAKSLAVRKSENSTPGAYTSVMLPNTGKPNTTYTVSFLAWSDKNTTLEEPTSIREYGGNWFSFFTVTPAGTQITPEPKRFVMSGTSGASLPPKLHIALKGGTGNDTVYYDDFVVTEGTYDGAYFDGNGFGNKWSGTPNNSVSYGRPVE